MNMKKILAGLTLGAVVLGGAVMATSPAFAAEKLGKGFRDGVHCNYADLSQEGKAEMQNYKLLVQELGIRTSSADNNDFVLDMDMMNYFHNSLYASVH